MLAPVAKIMAYEEGQMTPEEELDLFSSLIKSGMIFHLQGHYQRVASDMISRGELDANGNIL